MIKVRELAEKKYSLFLWCCTGLAVMVTLSFLVRYLNDFRDALASAGHMAGYLVLFIPLSIGLYRDSDEIGHKILLFYGLLIMSWVYGLLLSSASWLALCLGLLFMCGWIRTYDAKWSSLLFVAILLSFLLVGESIPQFGLRLAGSRDLMWASLFDEFLHVIAALLVVFPLILSEEKLSGKTYLLAIILLAAVLIDLDHINLLLFLRTGRGVLRPRTPAHSFLFGGIFSIPFWFHQDKKFGLAFMLAHFSHILRDSYGGGVVPLLWPFFPLHRYSVLVYPVGMVFLLLICVGFLCREHILEGYLRVARQVFWTGSFALLTSLGIIFFKKTPLALRHQILPKSAWWAQRGILLLLVLEIFFLSLWFPEEENMAFEKNPGAAAVCPSPHLISGVCAGLVSGNAYALATGIFISPYFVFLSVFGILFFLVTHGRKGGLYLSP